MRESLPLHLIFEGLCRCADVTSDCGAGYICTDPLPSAPGNGLVCRSSNTASMAGVRVFRDATDRWAPSRPIWNQHAYWVTNVFENGTIPSADIVEPNWINPMLNNFRQNVRTEGGGALYIPDLTVSHVGGRPEEAPECDTESAVQPLFATLRNRGTLAVSSNIDVTFHDGSSDGELLCTASASVDLAPGDCVDLGCDWEHIELETWYEVVAFVDESGALTECHEKNNLGMGRVRGPPFVI